MDRPHGGCWSQNGHESAPLGLRSPRRNPTCSSPAPLTVTCVLFTEVLLKTLNHMVTIMTGNDLTHFTVSGDSLLQPGQDLMQAKLLRVQDMTILKLAT